jgi:hypothetical protein
VKRRSADAVAGAESDNGSGGADDRDNDDVARASVDPVPGPSRFRGAYGDVGLEAGPSRLRRRYEAVVGDDEMSEDNGGDDLDLQEDGGFQSQEGEGDGNQSQEGGDVDIEPEYDDDDEAGDDARPSGSGGA